MDSRSTFINASLFSLTGAKSGTKWNMYIFYTGFNVVTYKNGLVSLDSGL
jgi:hypothetical protein